MEDLHFVHRFGSTLNSHMHYHVLVTDGVFSAGSDGEAVFHPALQLDASDIVDVQTKMRTRGLRWMQRHGHLDSTAVHSLDSADHAGGWSVDASVLIPQWDRAGLERLVRYCARPPMSGERLARLNDTTLVYSLRKPYANQHSMAAPSCSSHRWNYWIGCRNSSHRRGSTSIVTVVCSLRMQNSAKR